MAQGKGKRCKTYVEIWQRRVVDCAYSACSARLALFARTACTRSLLAALFFLPLLVGSTIHRCQNVNDFAARRIATPTGHALTLFALFIRSLSSLSTLRSPKLRSPVLFSWPPNLLLVLLLLLVVELCREGL